jgi:type 1 fimbriae regulatory protein FimB
MADSQELAFRIPMSMWMDRIRQNSHSVCCMAPSKTPPKPKTRRGSGTLQFLTQEELQRLFALIKSKRDRALFLLAYRHGLRASEIGLLQRTDVDLKQGRITIHRLKGSLSGIYPLQPDMIKLLRAYLRSRTDSSPYPFISNRGVPIDRRTLWCAMDTYGTQAGLPPEKRKSHRLKHSIATHLLDARGELKFGQDWVGHKNIQNTTQSAQLTNPRRHDEARKLFADHRVV